MDEKRGRGRRRKSWTGNMSEMTKMSMAQCSVKALDRSECRTMVSNLYAQTELRLIDPCQISGAFDCRGSKVYPDITTFKDSNLFVAYR